MPSKPLDRLLFAQGGRCFFCQQHLAPGEASVEHLVASAHGGSDSDENCVACCKALNSLLGRMSLKEKLRVILNQKGDFNCPRSRGPAASASEPRTKSSPHPSADDRLAFVIADLQKRGTTRPRTTKTLTSTISALFQKKISEHDVASLLETLQTRGVISVSGTKVSYHLPEAAAQQEK